MIHRNLSLLDIVYRMILALVLTVATWLLTTFWLFPIAMIMIVTSLAGYCPIYHALGINNDHE